MEAAWGNETTPNPPVGAVLTYHVGPNFSGNLVLTISDDQGRQVRRLDVPETPGINRATWNLRGDAPRRARCGAGGGGGGGGAVRRRRCGGARCGGAGAAGAAPLAPVRPARSIPASRRIAAAQAGAVAAAAAVAAGGGAGRQPGRFTAQLGKLNGDRSRRSARRRAFQVVPLPGKNW